jgi:hypothetical protein
VAGQILQDADNRTWWWLSPSDLALLSDDLHRAVVDDAVPLQESPRAVRRRRRDLHRLAMDA